MLNVYNIIFQLVVGITKQNLFTGCAYYYAYVSPLATYYASSFYFWNCNTYVCYSSSNRSGSFVNLWDVRTQSFSKINPMIAISVNIKNIAVVFESFKNTVCKYIEDGTSDW